MHNTTDLITRALRLTGVALHLAHGVVTVALHFPSAEKARRAYLIERWSARLLEILSIRVESSGAPPEPGTGSVMMIANHVSWLDVYALNTVCAARFVAKSEIRHWPVIGWFSEHVGTLFIERARRRHIVKINQEIAAALRQGDTFAVFPEGTTSPGDVVLPFHAPLLQPVLTCGAKLHPVAIRYTRADGSLCNEADYRHGKSLLDSLLLMVTQQEIRVRLHFLPTPACAGRHRREIAHEAAQSIAGVLGVPALSRHHLQSSMKNPSINGDHATAASYSMAYPERSTL